MIRFGYNLATMKKLFALVLGLVMAGGILGFTSTVDAAVRVRGYTRSTGTYVMPYYRSSPNSYRFDNYNSRGNYNPYTGRAGTRNYYGW